MKDVPKPKLTGSKTGTIERIFDVSRDSHELQNTVLGCKPKEVRVKIAEHLLSWMCVAHQKYLEERSDECERKRQSFLMWRHRIQKMAKNSNQDNGKNVESLSPSRPISEKSKQMSDESEGSEQSDTLNRNIAEESKPENLPESEVENETSTIMEPDTEVTLSVETPPDITWSPIQTRNRRKTLKNYLECDTGEITTLEIENKNQNNTEHQTLEFIINSSKAIKKKRLDTNRDKFKEPMKTGGNLVIEFSTVTF